VGDIISKGRAYDVSQGRGNRQFMMMVRERIVYFAAATGPGPNPLFTLKLMTLIDKS